MVQNKKRIISLILMLTLLVSSLVIGAITASAEVSTYSYTFASKQFSANGTKKLGDVNWTLAGNGNYWDYNGTKGQQFGSSNAPYESLTLTSDSFSNVTKIVINTSGASSISGNFTVFVGDTQVGDSTKLTASATDYSFDVAGLSGAIKFSYTQTSSKAIYIKSIKVVYGSATTEPETPVEPETPETPANEWRLVTNASALSVGDQIVIVGKKDQNYYALSTTQNTSNRGQAAVTKGENTVTFVDGVQIITLEAGTVEGTFAFYTGSGYLYAASSSSNHLKTQTTNNANGSWKIEIDANGVATIKAQGTNTRNLLRYNGTSSLFSCYASGQQDVSIYKLTAADACDHSNTTTTTVEAKCNEAGSITVTCNDCDDYSYTEAIPATGKHTYVCGKCNACTAEQPDELTSDVNIADYAAANGWKNDSDKYSTIKIDEYVTASAPTNGNNGKYFTNGENYRLYQTDNGTITIACSNNGVIKSVKITYTVANTGVLQLNGANIESGAIVSVNAGSITFSVGNTGDATNGQVRITAIEVVYVVNTHTAGADATCTTAQICTVCKAELKAALGHNTEGTVTHVDATCIETGVVGGTYCTRCGNGKAAAEATIPTTAHTERTPATCTEQAVCDVCGTSYGELAAHEYFYSCDAHCKNCGELTNEDASHTPVHVEAKAPICTENGNVEYWYCSVCGYAWLDVDCTIQTNLKAVVLGATCATNAVHTEGTEAGCNTTGLIENWYCANCDVYYLDAACTIVTNYKNLTIPATGHSADCVHSVAVVNGTYYDNIHDAVVNGGTVTILKDIVLTESIKISSKVTINLNEKNITTNYDADVVEIFYVDKNGDLTIKGKGELYASKLANATITEHVNVVSAVNGGKVYISGGNYVSGGCSVIYATRLGYIEISDGKFEAEQAYIDGRYYVLDFNEAETNGFGTIVVTGGTFVNFNPANHTNDGKGYTNKVAPGYITTKDADGNYVVSEFKAPTDPTEKVTISNPFTLAEDVILNGELVVSNGAIVDLNGHTLTTKATIVFSGQIKGAGELVVDKGNFSVLNGATLTEVPVKLSATDTTETFVFRAVKDQQRVDVEVNKEGVTTHSFVFKPSFAMKDVMTNAELFGTDGTYNNNIKFGVIVTRTNANGSKDSDIIYVPDTLVYGTNKAFKMTLTGVTDDYVYSIRVVVIYGTNTVVYQGEIAYLNKKETN